MSSPRFTPDELNAAINTAARRMTAATSSPDLRDRVMSRIAATPRWHWGWRLAMAGGAIGAVALSTAMLWDRQPLPAAITTDVASSAPPSATVAEDIALRAPDVAVTVPMPHAATAFSVSATELEWRARSVPALGEPDALHVAPLPSLELTVTPINIEPLSVPPLASGSSGAGGSF